jgi:O-antigen ligase
MTAVAAVALALLIGLLIHRAHQRGRPEQGAFWVGGVLLVESTIYPSPFDVPNSIVNPVLGGQSFRLVDVVVGFALVVQLFQKRRPTKGGITPLLWIAFLVWMTTAAVIGVQQHNDTTLLPFEAKAIVYLSSAVLVACVPAARWREPGTVRALSWAAALAAVLTAVGASGRTFDVSLPLLPLSGLGDTGSDAATEFAALGLLATALAITAHRQRVRLALCAVLLFLPTLPSGQRAAAIYVLVGLGSMVAAVRWTRRKRVRTTGTEVALAALAVLGLAVLTLITPSLVDGRPVELPFSQAVHEAIDGQGKKLSAQGRINQWEAVRPLLEERPFLGHGLGATYSYYEPGPPPVLTRTDLTHNLFGDLLLRMGLVGVVLFGAAVTSTVMDGLRAFRQRSDDVLAVLALAASSGVLAWIAKAMVESLFEKYRLAVLLGLLVGLVRSLTEPQGEAEPEAQATRAGAARRVPAYARAGGGPHPRLDR